MTKHYCRNLLLLVLGILLGINSLKSKALAYSDVFVLGSFSTTIISKSMSSEDQVISFGEKINFNYTIAADVNWTIKNTLTNVIVAFGSGDSLLRHVFEIPGNYQIDIQEPHHHDPDDCGHAHLPQKLLIKVSGVKMTYDMASLILSKEIIRGQETEGTTLSISAFVDIYDNIPKVFPFKTFESAGVNTNILGTLTNPNLVLNKGINILEFSLSGTALSSTYIMFDFLDFNGNIQCYYLMDQIK